MAKCNLMKLVILLTCFVTYSEASINHSTCNFCSPLAVCPTSERCNVLVIEIAN